MVKKTSRTKALAAKVIFATFEVLKENGGELPGREVLKKVEERVDLDDWAKSKYEKSGNIRWQSVLHFYSIDCIKPKISEFITKKIIYYRLVLVVAMSNKAAKILHIPIL